MSILIFIIILALLILVHEFGHFIVAKKSGIKVTEFGLGFPPKIWSKQKGETLYTLNAIPFGGFVKIFGENPDDESVSGPEKDRSIVHKNRLIQAAVLVAGVAFNILFAWILISAGYMVGLPTPVDHIGPGVVSDAHIIITNVEQNSPASRAEIKPGDTIAQISSGKYVAKEVTPEIVSNFIEAHGKEGVTLNLVRGKELLSKNIKAEEGVVEGKLAIGIGMENIGTLKLSFFDALWEGALNTVLTLKQVVLGLGVFFGQILAGDPDLSQVTGPVGIVGLVGDVSQLGFVYLLSFTAIISLNLAVINLLPFPALDGGRLVVVMIEAIIRRRLNAKVLNWVNGIGFSLLILLMVAVTVHDVLKFF